MTISTTIKKAGPFTSGGAGPFSFAFKVFSASDLLVVKMDASGTEHTLTLTTDYTVNLNADQDSNPGGTVTLTVALGTGEKLTILRQVPSTQGLDLTMGGGFYPESIEDALDKSVMLIQQLEEQSTRTVLLPVNTNITNVALPEPVSNKYIRWNSAGTALENAAAIDESTVSSYMKTLLDDADAATARATLGIAAGVINYTPAGTGAVTRTVQDKLRDVVSVKDFGAVGDGGKDHITGVITGTDNLAAFQKALNYLESIGGGSLYVPSGKYAFYNTGNPSTTQLFIKSHVTIFGDGSESSQLLFNDSTGTFSPLLNVGSTADFDIHLEKLGFISDWGANNDWTQRSHFMQLHTSGNVTITDCLFAYIRYFCCSIGYARNVNNVKITNCSLFRSAGDGISVRNCDSAIITNNYFKDINDDCIAVTSLDSEAEPVQNSAIISNNHIVDSQGIRVQGIKKATITGNVITRAHHAGITVTSYQSVEGYTPNFAFNISDNVIDTVFDGSVFSSNTGAGVRYIVVEFPEPTTNGSGYVGYANGSGGVVEPFNYFYINDTDASVTEPEFGPWFVNISNNILTRTYSTVASYSDYGVGLRYARTGPVSPAITEAVLGVGMSSATKGQIAISNSGRFVNISNNVLFGGNCGITLLAPTGKPYVAWEDVQIINNQISQYLRDGVNVTGAGTAVISGNKLNGDPLNTNLYRGLNGKWTFPLGYEYFNSGIRILEVVAEVKMNSFRNVQIPIAMQSLNQIIAKGNVYYCKPFFAGQHVDNIGIGDLTAPRLRGVDEVVIVDDDPASPNFTKILNICPRINSTMPTEGTYIEGHFVENYFKTIQGTSPDKYVVLGWMRQTTGSSHVLNTDWIEARSPVGL